MAKAARSKGPIPWLSIVSLPAVWLPRRRACRARSASGQPSRLGRGVLPAHEEPLREVQALFQLGDPNLKAVHLAQAMAQLLHLGPKLGVDRAPALEPPRE